MSRLNLRRCAPQVVAALFCLLPLAMSHAAEVKKRSVKSSRTSTSLTTPARTIHWQDISLSVKDSLAWLRTTTANNLLPRQDRGNEHLNWEDGRTPQFDLERQLFKSVRRDSRDSLMTSSQQSGLQMGSNTKFQWDVQRYWTAADRQEVAVKLGVHFDFR